MPGFFLVFTKPLRIFSLIYSYLHFADALSFKTKRKTYSCYIEMASGTEIKIPWGIKLSRRRRVRKLKQSKTKP